LFNIGLDSPVRKSVASSYRRKAVLVKCKHALPGKQYRTQKGILVEISNAKNPDKLGNPKAKFDRLSGRLLVHRVDEQTGKTDYANHVPVMLDYELEDGLDEETSKRVHRRHPGRKPHGDKTWRGWALKNRDKAERILLLGQQRGLYVKSTANYYSMAWNGVLFFALYRNGDLAFPKMPKALSEKIVKFPNDQYCEFRLKLAELTPKEFDIFVEKLNVHITERRDFLQSRREGVYDPVVTD